jgi:hypothetical protein
LFFWRLNPVCIDFPVTLPGYTSLGQGYKSKSYAISDLSLVFQSFVLERSEDGLTLQDAL